MPRLFFLGLMGVLLGFFVGCSEKPPEMPEKDPSLKSKRVPPEKDKKNPG